MRTALYPGSFDPLTYGHLDIIKRASTLFDHLYIGVIKNPNKTGLFTIEERIEMIEDVTRNMPNVSVVSFGGLTVKHAKELGASSIIRGLRAMTDFEYELQMSTTNHSIDDSIESLFLMSRTEFSFLSSSIVKELASYGTSICKYVPPLVEEKVHEKFEENDSE